MGRDMLRLQRAVLQSWLWTCNHQTIPGINRGSHCCQRQRHRLLHQPADYGSLHHHCQLRSKRTHLEYRILRQCKTSSVRCSNSVWTTTAASKTHRRGNADDPIPPQHPPRRFSSGGDRSVSDNPLLDLQRFVAVPLLAAGDVVFTPCREDVVKGCSLFVPGAKHRIRFLQGAYSPEQAPRYKLPEIAFIGRSNVGKSSLIKALFSEVTGLDVRTSKTPGHTKLLLFYQVGQAFTLVDMPGYGFNQPENFVISAEGYLKQRKNLRNTFLLVDSCVGFQPWDYVAIEMLEEFAIPYLVVLTKSDKASKRHLIESVMSVSKVIREQTRGCLPQPFLVSARSGAGLPLLKAFISYTTGNLKLQEP